MLLTSDKFLVQYDFTIHRSSNKHQTFFFIKKMISWKKASTESEGAKIIDNYDNNNNNKKDFWTLTTANKKGLLNICTKILIRFT